MLALKAFVSNFYGTIFVIFYLVACLSDAIRIILSCLCKCPEAILQIVDVICIAINVSVNSGESEKWNDILHYFMQVKVQVLQVWSI